MTPNPRPLAPPMQPFSLPLAALNADVQRIKYLHDPISWINNSLGEFMWSKQKEIFLSVANNRRTAVQSCHTSGKSHIAARVVAWWLETHPPGTAFVITSAGRGTQVKTVLWRYINRIHARYSLMGDVNQTEWWADILQPNGKISREMIGLGRKPADLDPGAFSGIHNRYMLVLFDEACQMAKMLWEYVDTLISNVDSKMLAIGNPDDPDSEFAVICKPDSGWNTIRVSAFDTPEFTGEYVPQEVKSQLISKIWVEEKRKKWGEDNALWHSKILGLFPTSTKDGLIPISWILAAQERDISGELDEHSRVELGVDVGAGGDSSTICVRKGYRCRIIREDYEPNTMITLSYVILAMREYKAELTKIDMNGIGTGMCNEAELKFERGELNLESCYNEKTQLYEEPIKGIMVGKAALDPERFLRLRAEIYWNLRCLFEDGLIDIDPNDDDLAAQLVAIKYKPNDRGIIQISPKSPSTKAKTANDLDVLTESPNRADALALCCVTHWEKVRPSATPLAGLHR